MLKPDGTINKAIVGSNTDVAPIRYGVCPRCNIRGEIVERVKPGISAPSRLTIKGCQCRKQSPESSTR